MAFTDAETLRFRQGQLTADVAKIIETVEKHHRTLSTNEERAVRDKTDEIQRISDTLADLEQQNELRAKAGEAAAAAGILPGHTSTRGGTYTPQSKSSYFKDMLDARQGDQHARERLDVHAREAADVIRTRYSSSPELRAISTTAGAGGEFIPPLWLIDDYIAALRPARATADALTNLPLPEHTDVLNVPKIATGTATAIQANQNTGVQQTDMTTGTVSASVITIAGGQTFSVQMFDQSPMAGTVDRVILQDLLADYTRQVGNLVLNGTGTAGQPTGLVTAAGATITYTDASPDFAPAGKLYGRIANAVQTVQTTRFLAPTHIVMHPRRWAWIETRTDAQSRPMVMPSANGPVNAMGIVSNGAAQGVVGKMLGCDVIVDPNVPITVSTNQDVILVIRATDSWLYESTARIEVFPQTYANQLSLFARVYNYMALAHRLPQSIAVVAGTGLTTPTF